MFSFDNYFFFLFLQKCFSFKGEKIVEQEAKVNFSGRVSVDTRCNYGQIRNLSLEFDVIDHAFEIRTLNGKGWGSVKCTYSGRKEQQTARILPRTIGNDSLRPKTTTIMNPSHSTTATLMMTSSYSKSNAY